MKRVSPASSSFFDDEEIVAQIYDEFREATKDLYDFGVNLKFSLHFRENPVFYSSPLN